jgi:hypothetical protein
MLLSKYARYKLNKLYFFPKISNYCLIFCKLIINFWYILNIFFFFNDRQTFEYENTIRKCTYFIHVYYWNHQKPKYHYKLIKLCLHIFLHLFRLFSFTISFGHTFACGRVCVWIKSNKWIRLYYVYQIMT